MVEDGYTDEQLEEAKNEMMAMVSDAFFVY